MPAISTISPMASEDWADDDFDLPEGQLLLRKQSKHDQLDEDWDAETEDMLTPGSSASNPVVLASDKAEIRIMRPALANFSKSDDDDDEGVSTIKAAATLRQSSVVTVEDDDFEDAFALPTDMTTLSLAPLSLHHQSSKSSFEWNGDRDQTTSSQSSDAYSSLGFADTSPSSHSTTDSVDTDSDSSGEQDLEGLVLPDELFESKQAGRHLTKILALKKAAVEAVNLRDSRPGAEEDFEMGLVIDDDFELSPSRLKQSAQKQKTRHNPRSASLPVQRSATNLRPPSRLRGERAKASVSPPPPMPKRSQTFQSLSPATAGPSTVLSSKPGSLRGQKSHTGLKPPSPTQRKLSRKASLSSLLEGNQSGSSSSASSSRPRYDEPTAASRAKSKASMSKASMSKLQSQEYNVPPTRPSTPSTSTAALRLTMPTQSRLKSRPPLSSVWGATASPASPAFPPGSYRTSSPLPPRPPSSLAKSRHASPALGPVQQMMRPQRSRVFGDGTELDGFEDLATDRDQESRFRVHTQNKNRIPGGTFSNQSEKGTLRRKPRHDMASPTNSDLSGSLDVPIHNKRPASSRQPSGHGSPTKKKRVTSPASHKRPTLIRNMGKPAGPRVIGDMKFNPKTSRWEGNESVLRDFDAVLTSTRPALITLPKAAPGSPAGSFASGMRRVGNMIFDPARLCWISALAPEEEEPDVFANMADDEDESWDTRGDTIRASLQPGAISVASSVDSRNTSSLRLPSPSQSHISMASDSGSDYAPPVLVNIDDSFMQSCRAAEERHRKEMKGWKFSIPRADADLASSRSHLFEIRALATRKY